MSSPIRMSVTARSLAVLAGGLTLAAVYLWHINRRRFSNCSKEKEKGEKKTDNWRAMCEEAEVNCVQKNVNQLNYETEEKEKQLNYSMGKANEPNGTVGEHEAKENCETSSIAQFLIDSESEIDTSRFEWCTVSGEQFESTLEADDRTSVDNECGGQCDPNIMGYNTVRSPSGHSEGSQDSGRATGGLASSMSPAEDLLSEFQPVYEFEVPHSLVGLIIGIKGKTIRELSVRASVRMTIRPHHLQIKMNSHQVCTVEGPREHINRCLRMLRRRFPLDRFPELNLRPVIPPQYQVPFADMLELRPFQLQLPEAQRCPVTVSCVVNTGHFFLQMINHSSFEALNSLDSYMTQIYSMFPAAPEVERPIDEQYFCVAPVAGGWFRVIIDDYNEEDDEVTVRFVDYGGTAQLPRVDLKQIRSDFMSLPFQAIECHLAHVEPNDGSSLWSLKSLERLNSLISNCLIEAFIVGYKISSGVPVVELFATDSDNKVVRIDNVLLQEGFAKASDPSKMRPVFPMSTAVVEPLFRANIVTALT